MLRVEAGDHTASQFGFCVKKLETFREPWVVGGG